MHYHQNDEQIIPFHALELNFFLFSLECLRSDVYVAQNFKIPRTLTDTLKNSNASRYLKSVSM